jgi:hypothetical protein
MTDEVQEAILALFDRSDRVEARSLLPKVEDFAADVPVTRVLKAVISLSDGDLDKLRHFSAAARLDWRDVVHWAEDPREQGEPGSWTELQTRLGLAGGGEGKVTT